MPLTIDINNTKGAVSPLWFGHNLEHTRSCMYRGLYAQLIRNRKFTGRPQRSGQAEEWYRIGPRETFFSLNETASYTRHIDPDSRGRYGELQKQIISSAAGAVCGIGQRDISLYEGRQYDFRLAVEGESGVEVTVRIKDALGEEVYWE